ncbi:PREDICTED: WAT1-related protein At5g40210-like [Camelina sativa]|uniref:WAT1-related protein n=1 Tax=Camelina sativa TaxID=90675 RepID=A0ABM0TFC6_CAMSA|nr:PREDICTED: WAT1-related protein At5g40210-like [Camelina sativa]
MSGRLCQRDSGIMTAMVAVVVSDVGMNTLFKAASSKGMSSYVFLVYSYGIGALLLLPSPFITHRSRSLPPLKFSVLCKMGLLGLLGCVYLMLGYTGIKYSSPTLASAMSNLTPAFTFIFAILFGMEKVSMRKNSSVAKVVGTIVSIVGALVATLYHGPIIFTASQPSVYLPQPLTPPPSSPSNTNWVIGGGLLALEYTLIAVSYIIQTHIMREYPSEFALALSHNVCVSVSCAFVSLFAEKNNPSAWIMRSKIMLICIIATGMVNSTGYVVESWTVRHKGPVFLAMFRPLAILTAVVLGAIFLGDSLYLGSVIGGTLISIGFYTVMWGKAKEEKADIETNVATSSNSKRIPLLMNYAAEKEV